MNDIIFYVLDVIIFIMLARMLRASHKIEIKTKAAPRWVIPCVFWAIAVIGIVNFSGVFRIIHTGCLILDGILYLFMESGLSEDGIVMIGRLYPYEKLTRIEVRDAENTVYFAKKGGLAPIMFREEQMKDVHSYLSKHAGIAKKDVRRKKQEIHRF